MTQHRDTEQLLDAWMRDGPTVAPDRVLDVLVDRIERQGQRPAWRLDWRRYTMNPTIKLAAAALAVVIVAVIGYNLLPGSTGVGGPAATPPSSPSAASTPTASPTQISSFTFKPRVTVQAPAGWTVDGDGPRSVGLKPPDSASGPGAGLIGVMSGPFVDAADADCENRPAVGVGASSAELVAAFSSDPTVVTTSAGTVGMGALTGHVLDIQLAPTWTGTCQWGSGKPAALLLLATADGPGFGLQGSELARLILVDVGGKVVAIIVSAADGPTQTAALAQAMPIVEAIQFIP